MTVDSRAIVGALAARDMLPSDLQSVLLVGSAARGWSNSRSDYDVYVISTTATPIEADTEIAVPLDPPYVPMVSFYAERRRWEVVYWLDDQVDQMLSKVSWEEFQRDQAVTSSLARREEAFLERLVTCVPLDGQDWLTERRRQLNASAFQSLMVSRSLGTADRFVEDALGQVEAGHLDSAVLSARTALGHTVDALLEQHGQYGSYAVKWRPQRFRAAAPTALSFEDYWALETMATYRPDDPARWVNEVLQLCQDLAMKIEI